MQKVSLRKLCGMSRLCRYYLAPKLTDDELERLNGSD